MQRHIERLIIGLLVVIVVGLALHTPLTVFIGSQLPAVATSIKAWKEILMVVVALLLIVYVWRRSLFAELLRDRLLLLIGAIALLHLVLVAWFDNSYVSELSGLVIDLRNYLLLAELYVVGRYITGARRTLLKAFGIGALIVIGFGLLQATVLPKDILSHIGYSKETIQPYLTVDLNDDYIRINSTLRGPNPVGAFVVLVLSLVVAWAARHKQLLKHAQIQAGIVAFACSSLIVLWASHSRSAWLGAVAAGMAFLVAVLPRRVAVVSVTSGLVGMALLIGGLFMVRDHPVVANVFFHTNHEGGSEHKSDDGHLESLQHGVEAAASAPVGAGVGSTGSASLASDKPVIIENQYLFMAHESGWLGVFLQIVLLVWVMIGLWQRRADWLSLGIGMAGAGLIIVGMLLPVWADDLVGLYWWGIAGLALGSSATIRTNVKHTKTHPRYKKTA